MALQENSSQITGAHDKDMTKKPRTQENETTVTKINNKVTKLSTKHSGGRGQRMEIFIAIYQLVPILMV